MIRTGIIGRGMAARIFHAPLIEAEPGLQLVGAVGRADAPGILADPAIALVVIATPNETHAELAEAALRAGKHVVIDKPFVVRSEDGEHLIDLAAREGRMLAVFQNRRWDGDFLTVAGLVRSGRLGEIDLVESHWDRFRPVVPDGWRETPGPGAGTLWNLGPHMLDQMLMLFGTPDSLEADLAVQREGARTDDYFALTLRYGKMRAVLIASNLVGSPRPRFALHGARGSYVVNGLDGQENRLAAGINPLDPSFGDEALGQHGVITVGNGSEPLPTTPGRYREFYRGVVTAIRDGTSPPVDPVQVMRSIRMLEYAHDAWLQHLPDQSH